MENESRLKAFFIQVSEKLNEQQWFQELKEKWGALDPNIKTYVKLGTVGTGVLSVLIMIFSIISSIRGVKDEYIAKTEILSLLRSANDEIRALKRSSGGSGQMANGRNVDWNQYLMSLGSRNGVGAELLSIKGTKGGTKTESTEETLIDIELKNINIKQLVRYAFSVENSEEPVKIRNMTINTVGADGYLKAQMSLSAFKVMATEN